MSHSLRLTGPGMQKHLAALGIPVRRVVRKRKTGEYVADFFIPPALGEPIAQKHAILPAHTYAKMLRERLPGARIVRVGEAITDWRTDPAERVRYEASVTFTVPER